MRFEIMLGPEDGEFRDVQSNTVSLGRRTGNDLFFPYAGKISETHAFISREGSRFFLTDCGKDGKGSTNGTDIIKSDNTCIRISRSNRETPCPGEKVPVEAGDVLILGNSIWLRFLGG